MSTDPTKPGGSTPPPYDPTALPALPATAGGDAYTRWLTIDGSHYEATETAARLLADARSTIVRGHAPGSTMGRMIETLQRFGTLRKIE